jgi:orotidine-5'-phosphate decarboxylase
MSSFAERFLELAKARSPLCVGLDPTAQLLQDWGFTIDADGVRRFCERVIEAAGDRVAVFKPQAAFFEQFGAPGMQELSRVIQTIRQSGALSLIDCKRADIADTMEGYAQAMLGAESGFGGDAMTAVAYLGFESLLPLLRRATACSAAVFVVVRSSNPGGAVLQDAQLADGRSIADALADDITEFNATVTKGIGPAGAVIGATIQGPAAAILSRLPQSLILAPGIGAQGANFADIAHHFGPAVHRTLPSVSRGILGAGPSVVALRNAIEKCRQDAWRMLYRTET